MSKQVPRDKPLSADDRAYLLMRGQQSTVEYLDQQFPPEDEADLDEDLDETDEDEDLDDEEEEDLEDDDEDEEPDYDSWTVQQLKDELTTRTDDEGAVLSTTGNKAELAARLREHDAQQ